jgi:hypothetical protein
MPRTGLPILLAVVVVAVVPAGASALDEPGYWAFADVMRDGGTRRVGDVRIPLRRIAHLLVESRNATYLVLPRLRPLGATVHLLHPHPQSSAPLAGHTLAVQLAPESRVRSARFSARFASVERKRAAETAARLAE